ncbi:MAG: PKD domain-containing protein [Thermoplasmata archaeon]|nr:PKD domain-containing protein [Thermoplasmata archaeon]
MSKKGVSLSFAALFVISALAAVPASAETVEWSEPLLIGVDAETWPNEPSLASNDQGWMIAAWTDYDGSESTVYANRFNPEMGWTGAEAIGTGSYVAVGIDEAGNSTVAWTDRMTIMATRYVPMYGEWDEVSEIPGTEPNIIELRLSVCGNGGAVTVWRQWDGEKTGIFASTRDVESAWSDAVPLQEEGLPHGFSVAMDNSRNAIVVYTMYDEIGYSRSIWAKHYTYGQGWGIGVLIESQTGYSFAPALGMNEEGVAIAVWQSRMETGYAVFANVYRPELGWEGEDSIEVSNAYYRDIAVAIDKQGYAVASWSTLAPDGLYDCISASLYDSTSGWGAPATISDATRIWETRACAVTGDGMYIVWNTWSYETFPMRICSNHYDTDEGWVGVSIITESVNLTSPAMVPNHLGGVTLAWAGLYTDWGVYVSSCSGSGSVSEDPTAVVDVYEGNNWKTWRFDGRASTDDVGIVEYLWDFGDGTYADNKVTCHTYQKAGEYDVTLTVWDDEGNSDSTSITLSIRPNSGE